MPGKPAQDRPRESLRHRLLGDLPREVAVLATVAFCVALGFGIVAPALPVFATSFGVSVARASSVVSVFALVRLIGALPAGWLVQRIGERRVLGSGLTIVAVSSALAGLSTTFEQLLLLRGVGGLGSAMFSVSAVALLLRSVKPEQRGRASSVFHGGFLLGGIAGPAVGGLVTGISIRLPFFVYAGTLAVAVLVVAVLAPPHRPDPDTEAPFATAEVSAPGWSSLALALRQRAYLTALVVNLGNGFTSFGLRAAIIPLFVIHGLGRGPAWTGYGLLTSALVDVTLLVPAGRLTDRRGRRPSLLIGTAATALGFTALALTDSVVAFLGSMAILGVGTAFLGSAPAAVVGDINGDRRGGPVVATYQMMSDIGAVLGPLVAGYVLDRTGSYSTGFGVGAAVIAVGFVLAVLMPETLRRSRRFP